VILFIKIFGLSSPRIFVPSLVSACRQGLANSQSVVSPGQRVCQEVPGRGIPHNLVPPPPSGLLDPSRILPNPGNPGNSPVRTRPRPSPALARACQTVIPLEKVPFFLRFALKSASRRGARNWSPRGALLINVFFGWEWTGSQKDLAFDLCRKIKFGPEKLDPLLPKSGRKMPLFPTFLVIRVDLVSPKPLLEPIGTEKTPFFPTFPTFHRQFYSVSLVRPLFPSIRDQNSQDSSRFPSSSQAPAGLQDPPAGLLLASCWPPESQDSSRFPTFPRNSQIPDPSRSSRRSQILESSRTPGSSDQNPRFSDSGILQDSRFLNSRIPPPIPEKIDLPNFPAPYGISNIPSESRSPAARHKPHLFPPDSLFRPPSEERPPMDKV
jgi:hypothetical protein